MLDALWSRRHRRLLNGLLPVLLAGCVRAGFGGPSTDGAARDSPVSLDSAPDRFAVPEAGCPGGFSPCGAECVDLKSNAGNCGGCGKACGSAQHCVAAHCACLAGGCLIGAICIGDGTTNTANACEQCNASTNANGWTLIAGCGSVSTAAGGNGPGAVDGPAATASFYAPAGIVVDASGAVYVADRANCKIRKLAGGQVTTVAGTGTAGFADGAVAQAQFNLPEALALGPSGEIFVADDGNNRVRVIAGGTVSTLAGSGAAGFQDGAAAAAQFQGLVGVAVSPSGVVYVADLSNNRIRSIAGGQVTTLAGTGVMGFKDGPAAQAQLRLPAGVAWAKPDTIYVSEFTRIRVVAGGQVSTVAGTGLRGHLDGPAASAMLDTPAAMAIDGAGAMYIADAGDDYCIRMLSTAAMMSTLAGACDTPGFANGPLANARFGDPRGIALAPDGTLYVSDMTNNAIRHITW